MAGGEYSLWFGERGELAFDGASWNCRATRSLRLDARFLGAMFM